jgi:hypothetical protein
MRQIPRLVCGFEWIEQSSEDSGSKQAAGLRAIGWGVLLFGILVVFIKHCHDSLT